MHAHKNNGGRASRKAKVVIRHGVRTAPESVQSSIKQRAAEKRARKQQQRIQHHRA